MPDKLSQCHRILGNLAIDLKQFTQPSSPAANSKGHLSGLSDGGYRIFEADIRIALAWAHLAGGNPTIARQEVTRAQTMSVDMGYHWGQVDAAEPLDHL